MEALLAKHVNLRMESKRNLRWKTQTYQKLANTLYTFYKIARAILLSRFRPVEECNQCLKALE